MVSSAQGGNHTPWINASQSADGFEKSSENMFSSISLSSTLSGVGNRLPALSASSLSTLEEDAGHKTGEFWENTSGCAPLSPPLAKSKNNNNGTMHLSHPNPNAEYEDSSQNVSSPLFAMSQISLNQYFSAPLQPHPSLHQVGTQLRGVQNDFSVEGCNGSDNSDYFLNEVAFDSLSMKKIRRDEFNAIGSNIHDQLDRKQNEFQNESLFGDKAHAYGGLSALSREKDGRRLYPVKSHLETSQAHVQDRENYDIILGGTDLNPSNKDIRPADLDGLGNRVGSGYDASTNFFEDDGRISSTIRPNYLSLRSMGSVDEHGHFLGNRARSSSLGYPVRTGSSFDHHSQYRTRNFREAYFGQGFQDKNSLTCAGGNVDEPYNSNHAQQACLNPTFGSLQGRLSSDEMRVQHFNGLEYPARCTPPQTLPSENYQNMPSHCSAFNQDSHKFEHTTTENLQQVGSPRQRIISADGIYNKCHRNFQKQGQDFNSPANSSNIASGHSSNVDSINYNFDVQQTNRPRSYSSGTNVNEYVRSQSFRMHSPQLMSVFSESHKLSQRTDGSTVQHAPDRNLFAPNTTAHRSHQHAQGYKYTNFHVLPQDCNYASGNFSRNCSQNSISQVVEKSHRGDVMAPFGNNTPLVRDSSGNGIRMDIHNSYNNVVRHEHREKAPMNVTSQHFASVDSLVHYQGKNNLPKARPKCVYNVKFKRTQRHFILGQRMQRDVQIGSYVKVEADRGEDLGIVISCISSEKVIAGARLNSQYPVSPSAECDINSTAGDSSSDISIPSSVGNKDLKRVLRLATNDEIFLLIVKKEEEEELLKVCEEKIVQRSLPMNVVDAEYQFDRHKLTFFFEAEGRVDFRELVRDLFSIYKTRIWMQQLDKSVPGVEGSRPAENPNKITDIDVLPKNCD